MVPVTQIRSLIYIGGLVISMSLCSGCASIVSGTKQQLSFESNPSGATVSVDEKVLGTTPLVATVPRKSAQQVSFAKDGFKTLSVDLQSKMNGWFWGNILIGGFLGSTTDGATGAVHQYTDSDYLVTLEPAAASRLETSTSLSLQQSVRQYIVVNYDEIQSDVRRGHGDSLAPLFALLDVRQEDQSAALKRIKVLLETYPKPAAFSEQVASTYVGK